MIHFAFMVKKTNPSRQYSAAFATSLFAEHFTNLKMGFSKLYLSVIISIVSFPIGPIWVKIRLFSEKHIQRWQ